MSDTTQQIKTSTPEMNEGSLPAQAIGRILGSQPVANIEFSPQGGVKITMISAPQQVIDHTPITGIEIPSGKDVDPSRLKAQLDALSRDGLLGPAAKELAAQAKQAIAQGPDPAFPMGGHTVTLETSIPSIQQVASTPTDVAPKPNDSMTVSPEAAAAAAQAMASVPAQQQVQAAASEIAAPIVGKHTAMLASQSPSGAVRSL